MIRSSSCNIVIQETQKTHIKLKDFQNKASFASLGAEGGGIPPLAGGPIEAAGRGDTGGVSAIWVPLGSWASWLKWSPFGILDSGVFAGEETRVNDRFSPLTVDPLAFPLDSRSESLVPAG